MSQTKNLAEDFLLYLKSIIFTETGRLLDVEIDNYIDSLYENLPKNELFEKSLVDWVVGIFIIAKTIKLQDDSIIIFVFSL